VATTAPPPENLTGDLVATPASITRRASPVRSRLRASIALLVVAAVLTAVLWASIIFFRSTLTVDNSALVIWTVVVIALGLAGSSILWLGIKAVVSSVQAKRFAAAGEVSQARIASEDAREWGWWVGGIGAALTVVAFFLWFLSADGGVIRITFLDGEILLETMPDIIDAFWLNIRIFMVAEVLVLVWSLVVALGRLFPGKAGMPVRFLATAYCDVFRGFPAIVTLFLVVFGLQLAKLPVVESLSREQQRFWLPVLALVLVYGAYVAEVYRSGLESIHWSQTAAARSLGLSGPQTMRHVVIPQAVRRIIPPLLNDFIGLQKDTALLAFVGTFEALNVASSAANRYFNQTPILGAGLCFLVITIPLARFTDYLVKRDATRMRASS
jgi:polar amino acid transport system permease protein